MKDAKREINGLLAGIERAHSDIKTYTSKIAACESEIVSAKIIIRNYLLAKAGLSFRQVVKKDGVVFIVRGAEIIDGVEYLEVRQTGSVKGSMIVITKLSDTMLVPLNFFEDCK